MTVLDASNWQAAQIMRGSGQSVNAIAFSPGDKLIASGGDDSMVKVWDIAKNALVRTYAGHAGSI